VTGATGFVGSHLVERLLKDGYHVKCLVRNKNKLKWLENLKIEVVEGDLNNLDALKQGAADVDVIFHLAGVLFGLNESDFYEGNVQGVQNLLEAAESNSNLKRFLHVSTQAVAGPAPSKDQPITEDSEKKPLTWYGQSKLAAEQKVLEYNDKFPITIIRPGAVYGPRDYAIFEVFKAAKSGFNLKVGSQDKFVNFIHVFDLVDAIVAAAESEKTIGKDYFIVNDHPDPQDIISVEAIKSYGKKPKNIVVPVFVIRLVATISEFFGKLFNKVVVLNRQKLIEITQQFWVCSNQRAKDDFNFEPKFSTEDGVKMTSQWYKDHGWL
jgi:dihydroflavonol-4-reductase